MAPKKAAKKPSVAADNAVTPTQRRDRLDAFVRRLSPHVVDNNILEFYLRSNDWDLETAHAEYIQDRTNHLELLRGRGDRDADDAEAQGLFNASMVIWNDNPEQERRDAAYAFNERVRRTTLNTQQLSRTEASLWLNINHWDVGLALRNLTSVAGNADGIRQMLGRRYDRMRTPLAAPKTERKKQGQDKTAEKIAEDKRQEQRDERLAEFINITGRPDWYSLLTFLADRDYDLVQAVQDWYTDGVPPFSGTTKRENGGMRDGPDGKRLPKPRPQDCVPRSTMPKKKQVNIPNDDDDSSSSSSSSSSGSDESEGEDNFGDDLDRFLSDSDAGSSTGSSPAPSSSTPSKQQRERVQGFIIDDYADAAKASAPNPHRYLLEYIAKGKYHSNVFEKRASHWWPDRGQADPGANSGRVVFDWDLQKHVNGLNAWWRQNRSRVADEKKRAASQKWSQEENDFLYALNLELLDQLKQKHPTKTEDQLVPLVVPTKTKEEWAKRINEKFVGRLMPGSTEPRRPRESAALMTQRGRCPAIIEKFKVPKDKVYAASAKRAEEKRAEKGKAKDTKKQDEGKTQQSQTQSQKGKGKGKAVDADGDSAMSGVESLSSSSSGGETARPPASRSPTPPESTPSRSERSTSPVDLEALQAAAMSIVNDANGRVTERLANAGINPQDSGFAETLRDGLIEEIEDLFADGGMDPMLRDSARAFIETQYQQTVNQPSRKRTASPDSSSDDGQPGPSRDPKRRR
ncbi:hypothetical protein PV08_03482 [Exophiala spinifera]|uniref:Uncharacterized protein n=1 Tax=Exophiala spinifera TaxID=91928 RepID=A0A0D2BJU2_9EURO|nr:uncharacterized protein PV08_03482 [Exophiala spinifera]KIW19188.1 hypothetical protein PV08_03482 [Exophiala spinifera]